MNTLIIISLTKSISFVNGGFCSLTSPFGPKVRTDSFKGTSLVSNPQILVGIIFFFELGLLL